MKKIYSNLDDVLSSLRNSEKKGLVTILTIGSFLAYSQSSRVADNSLTAHLSIDGKVATHPVSTISEIKNTNKVALTGNYNIGVGGDYTTITAAVAAYNSEGVSGNVNFILTDATYPGETFPIVINSTTGTGPGALLTIKPKTGVTTSIAGSATSLFKINGGDYIIFDGSNNGSSSRDLTINNTNTTSADSPVVFWVANADATNGATYVVIKNSNINGASSSGTIAGIVASAAAFGAAAVIANDGLHIENNVFTKAQNGIFAYGNPAMDSGYVIKNNIFGSTTVTDKMGFRGAALQNITNFEVSGNQVLGVETASTSTATGLLIGAAVSNGKVFDNKISNVKNTNSLGYGAAGIFISSSNPTATNLMIYNNFVSSITGTGYSGGGAAADNGNGIMVNFGGGLMIQHNTVAMNVNQTNSGRPSAINFSNNVTAGANNIVTNNIFVNSQTTTGSRYAIYSSAPNTAFAQIDYNDYYTTGTNLGYIGSDRSNLAALQTGFGGNTNSLNILPVFTSATDLHLTITGNSGLDNKGMPNPLVTKDIDGETRSTTTPDMGADEFTGTLAVSDLSKIKMSVYPNPVVDVVNVSSKTNISSIEVYSTSGQLVLTHKLSDKTASIDMKKLSAGVYMVKISSDNNVETFKIIKK